MATDAVVSTLPAADRPMPSEAWLLARYQRHGDAAAREELVRRMMPLVRRGGAGFGAPGARDRPREVAARRVVHAVEAYAPALPIPPRTLCLPHEFRRGG